MRAVPRRSGRNATARGIVIGEGDLILTIGYLIVEADEVKVVDSRGRTLPAKIVGYDHATGLGLIRALGRRSTRGRCRFGDSARLAERDPVMIVNSGGPDDVTLAYRRFAPPVHRKLGVHARPGDLHLAADAQLERRRADRSTRAS